MRQWRGFFGIRMRGIGWGSMNNIKKPKVHKLEGAPFLGRTTGENERQRGERYDRSGSSVEFRRKQESHFLFVLVLLFLSDVDAAFCLPSTDASVLSAPEMFSVWSPVSSGQ